MGRKASWPLAVTSAVTLAAVLSMAPAGAGEATRVNDARGDISLPDVDIVRVEAGVLPPGNPRIPTGTQGLAVWVKLTFAGVWPPGTDVFSWFAADSLFFPDPDKPGETIHLSAFTQRHDGVNQTGPSCARDSSSCPPGPFPVQAVVTPEALFLIQGIPYQPAQMSLRAQAGVQPTATAAREVDNVPDDPAARIPVNLDPVDPFAPSGRTTPGEDGNGADTDARDGGNRDQSAARDTDSRTDDDGFPVVLVVIIVVVVVGIVLLVFAVARRRPVGGTYPDWEATYPDWSRPDPD